MPASKKENKSKTYCFLFFNLHDIESYAKTIVVKSHSSLYEKNNQYILSIDTCLSEQEESFLEARIAEYNGRRIAQYYSDESIIEKTALEVLSSL